MNFVLVSQPLPLSPGFSPSLFFFPKISARRPFSTESSAFCRQLKRNIHFAAFWKKLLSNAGELFWIRSQLKAYLIRFLVLKATRRGKKISLGRLVEWKLFPSSTWHATRAHTLICHNYLPEWKTLLAFWCGQFLIYFFACLSGTFLPLFCDLGSWEKRVTGKGKSTISPFLSPRGQAGEGKRKSRSERS